MSSNVKFILLFSSSQNSIGSTEGYSTASAERDSFQDHHITHAKPQLYCNYFPCQDRKNGNGLSLLLQ